jgi:hypothetical protein
MPLRKSSDRSLDKVYHHPEAENQPSSIPLWEFKKPHLKNGQTLQAHGLRTSRKNPPIFASAVTENLMKRLLGNWKENLLPRRCTAIVLEALVTQRWKETQPQLRTMSARRGRPRIQILLSRKKYRPILTFLVTPCYHSTKIATAPPRVCQTSHRRNQ